MPRDGTNIDGTTLYVKHYIPHHTIQNTYFSGLDETSITINFANTNISFVSLYAGHSPNFPVGDLTQLFSQNTH